MGLVQAIVRCSYLLLLITLLPFLPQSAMADSVINVATGKELLAALQAALPGQTIKLADGRYTGRFIITRSGSASQYIHLQGSRNAIIEGASTQEDFGFHLRNSKYWSFSGFTIHTFEKGIVLDNSDNNEITNLRIYNIGQEAIRFRTCSSNNVVSYSEISDTGVVRPEFGEGIYIGSDSEDWKPYICGATDPETRDKSHKNRIIHNKFGPNIRAEGIDIKEGTVEGEITDNIFDATGISGINSADSWVDIKGNSYKITGNIGLKNGGTNLRHGFETNIQVEGWGRNNIFDRNIACLFSSGYGFSIENEGNHGNVVYTNNEAYGAARGVSNIRLTIKPSVHESVTGSSQINQRTTIFLPAVQKSFC